MTTPLERLKALVPPAAGSDRDWAWDWGTAEQRLGHALPQDYKDLVDAYGRGGFDGHVELLVAPPQRSDSEITIYNDGHMEDLAHLWSMLGDRPSALTEDDVLVTWAVTIDSDTLNWLVKPGEPPERWPVAILDADLGECEIYPMTCTEFLEGLLSGTITSPIISHHLNPEGHVFHSYADL